MDFVTSFISNFLYYNTIGLTFGISSFLFCEYISEPKHFITNVKNHLNTVKLWSFDKIISFYMLYNDLKDTYFSNTNIKHKEETINNNNNKNQNLFLDSGNYKKIKHNSKEYIVHKDNPISNIGKLDDNDIQHELFFGINICINGTTYENVKQHLDTFMIKDAEFDKTFIRLFMKQYYNLEKIDGYEIHILDKAFSSFTIKENNIIKIGESKFTILTNILNKLLKN